MSAVRPRLAVWKFSSCDGCQLSLLASHGDLLQMAQAMDIAYFAEASSSMRDGPYDISLVEGSVSTTADVQRLQRVREQSGLLVAIGACATGGGIQALRNPDDAQAWERAVYPRPQWLHSLPTATPLHAHVQVDHALQGCPVDAGQLQQLLAALLAGRRAEPAGGSVCMDCKVAGHVCVMVQGEPCLGPIIHAGCGALCPGLRRGCYGCFGPLPDASTSALAAQWLRLGASPRRLRLALHSIHVVPLPADAHASPED